MYRVSRSAFLALIVSVAWLAAGCGDDGTGPKDDSEAGKHLWSDRYGDASEQWATAICFNTWAEPIMAGTFEGTIDFGGGALTSAGGRDYFLVEFASGDTYGWSKRFGNGSSQEDVSVAVTAGSNVILAGELVGAIDFGGGPLTSAGNGDVFVAVFANDGSHYWSKRFGDASDQQALGVAGDASGNVIVAGFMQGTVNFGGGALTSAGSYDAFLAKFGPDGTHLWSKRFGDAGSQTPNAVAVDTSGNVVITGAMEGTVNFGGGALTSGGAEDAFVAKFAPDGTHLWSKRFGDANTQSGRAVACDDAGNAVVAGHLIGSADFGGGALTSAGSYDAFVAKFDPDGNHLWSRRFGDADIQTATAITVEAGGKVIVAGDFYGTVDCGGGELTSAGDRDVFLAVYGADGAHLWSKRFGDATLQRAYDVDVYPTGHELVLAGGFYGAVDFGGGALASAGLMDVFYAGFRP